MTGCRADFLVPAFEQQDIRSAELREALKAVEYVAIQIRHSCTLCSCYVPDPGRSVRTVVKRARLCRRSFAGRPVQCAVAVTVGLAGCIR